MSDVRIVTLDCLLRRLESVLGSESLLLRRFERGLRLEDERCLSDAMSSLRLYPDHVRRSVEDAVMGWLFGGHAESPIDHREAWPAG